MDYLEDIDPGMSISSSSPGAADAMFTSLSPPTKQRAPRRRVPSDYLFRLDGSLTLQNVATAASLPRLPATVTDESEYRSIDCACLDEASIAAVETWLS